MSSSPITSILRREREVLEELLDLAKCQIDVLDAKHADDLEILSSFQSAAMHKLNTLDEQDAEGLAPLLENDSIPNAQVLHEVQELNSAILALVDRIVNFEDKTGFLSEQYENEHRLASSRRGEN
jgi:hypothetical protein